MLVTANIMTIGGLGSSITFSWFEFHSYLKFEAQLCHQVSDMLFHFWFALWTTHTHTHQTSSCLRLWKPKETSATLSDQVVCLDKITYLGPSLSLAVVDSEQIYSGSFFVEPTAFHMLHDYIVYIKYAHSPLKNGWVVFSLKCLENEQMSSFTYILNVHISSKSKAIKVN